MPNNNFSFQRKRVDQIPESKILDELEKAAAHFHFFVFGKRDFDKVASISSSTVRKYFAGSWTKAMLALDERLKTKGLKLQPRAHAPNRIFSDEDLFIEMERIWKKVGQRPSRNEWEMSSPSIAYNTYKQRFGGWTNACLRFIEYKMGNLVIADDYLPPINESLNNKVKALPYNKANTRNVPLSIRLKVLNRDNFRCVFCGKSPATEVGVQLHIDHMIPFSKGGKSEENNLQTLCSECNLGKSNRSF